MYEDLKKTKLIVDLLRQTSNLQVVREFLKAKGVASSGNWDDIFSKRIEPAVAAYKITNADLIALLRSVEECGRQHIFLYTCPSSQAIELMERHRISGILKKRGQVDLLTHPRVLDQPQIPELADVRWDTADVDISVTIKEIESREFHYFIGTELHDGNIHKVYGRQFQRAVNVAKLHRDGLLEIRLASLANTSKYEAAIRRFWKQINDLIPLDGFTELSLSPAKDRLWVERVPLAKLIRYSDSTVRDDAGNVLRAAAGSDKDDLNHKVAVGQSLDFLLQTDKNAYCEGANIWFKKADGLSAESHVLLNGDSNEFALPANCSEADYNYVLSQLRYFNRRVP
ncbi:MAG: hypothetical protein V4443_12290 [Pseudomonadota bacterium]